MKCATTDRSAGIKEFTDQVIHMESNQVNSKYNASYIGQKTAWNGW
jgi:hypothetical protein